MKALHTQGVMNTDIQRARDMLSGRFLRPALRPWLLILVLLRSARKFSYDINGVIGVLTSRLLYAFWHINERK